ncbi:zf-TFIIB domain-containing protein [Noviherbaspirillum massiliense]|uniref:TFIIB-type zinc ribbon-containing protein n=1 Tax=Noviherbaspirillum massiliense TaxID=1465823 RepID=UPI0003025693|nr:zf-TFIIB domain-containing protein [Noviherbaspirillum massiliense]
MDCPVCRNMQLVMSERQGIEIDYCPNCRGVWLDRGELEKIIDRSAQPGSSAAPRQTRNDSYPLQEYGHPASLQGQSPQGYPKKKKREGFLGDLFDFD